MEERAHKPECMSAHNSATQQHINEPILSSPELKLRGLYEIIWPVIISGENENTTLKWKIGNPHAATHYLICLVKAGSAPWLVNI